MTSRYVDIFIHQERLVLINRGKIWELAAGKAIWLGRQISSFQAKKNISLCFTNSPHVWGFVMFSSRRVDEFEKKGSSEVSTHN